MSTRRLFFIGQLCFGLAMFVLSGCQTSGPAPLPDPEPVVVTPEPAPQKPAPAPKPTPVIEKPAPQPVTIVVSKDIPAYSGVADALSNALMKTHADKLTHEVVYLEDTDLEERLADASNRAVIAIGEPALEAARRAKSEVIYAQVFNPPAAGRGITAIPTVKAQLAYWQSKDPAIRRIGVIASPAFANTLADFLVAAGELGLSVEQRIVTSDREGIFEFRRIVPTIDAFIVLPDERLLSPSFITDVMRHGLKNEIKFLTYNELLYNLGADVLIAQNYEEVASRLVALLDDPEAAPQPLETFRARLKGRKDYVDVRG